VSTDANMEESRNNVPLVYNLFKISKEGSKLILVLYCAISGPTRMLSDLSEVALAVVVVGAPVGVLDPPLPPSGEFFPDLDQKR